MQPDRQCDRRALSSTSVERLRIAGLAVVATRSVIAVAPVTLLSKIALQAARSMISQVPEPFD